MAEHEDAAPVDPATARSTPSEPYTVHDDTDRAGGDASAAHPVAGRRTGPDPVALLAGLAALLVAVLALTDVLGGVDPRWALAVVALGVGGTVLLATLRRRRP